MSRLSIVKTRNRWRPKKQDYAKHNWSGTRKIKFPAAVDNLGDRLSQSIHTGIGLV